MPFAMTATRSLGRGVALDIACPDLVALRGALAASWKGWLTPQDRQGYRPHSTVQNKVSADEARAARAEIGAALPIHGTVAGLALWHYRGGPWEEAGRFAFSGSDGGGPR